MIDLPRATEYALQSVQCKEEKRNEFRAECRAFLIAIIKKIQERSPLKYLLVRMARNLVPANMVNKKMQCVTWFGKLAYKIFEMKHITSAVCDKAKVEYALFLNNVVSTESESFLSFDIHKDRLDDFLGQFLKGNDKYKNLTLVCSFVFVLSHGQSQIERGFNINKNALVENQSQLTLKI